jgi:hypothetical protein
VPKQVGDVFKEVRDCVAITESYGHSASLAKKRTPTPFGAPVWGGGVALIGGRPTRAAKRTGSTDCLRGILYQLLRL